VERRGRRAQAEGWERDEAIVAWIYGSILTGAAVAVATGAVAETVPRVLLYVGATMLVVWLAHVYADFVGRGGRIDVGDMPRRLAHAGVAELPILASSIPTLIAIALCRLTGASVSATGYVGLTVTITTMVVAATYAARNAGAGRAAAGLAASGALVIGAALIAAKVALK
jgi:hypothetical protein